MKKRLFAMITVVTVLSLSSLPIFGGSVSGVYKPRSESEDSATDEAVVVYSGVSIVKVVQESLNKLGYDCGTPDGVAGKKTHAALSQYQTDKGLTVTDDITVELLNSFQKEIESSETELLSALDDAINNPPSLEDRIFDGNDLIFNLSADEMKTYLQKHGFDRLGFKVTRADDGSDQKSATYLVEGDLGPNGSNVTVPMFMTGSDISKAVEAISFIDENTEDNQFAITQLALLTTKVLGDDVTQEELVNYVISITVFGEAITTEQFRVTPYTFDDAFSCMVTRNF